MFFFDDTKTFSFFYCRQQIGHYPCVKKGRPHVSIAWLTDAAHSVAVGARHPHRRCRCPHTYDTNNRSDPLHLVSTLLLPCSLSHLLVLYCSPSHPALVRRSLLPPPPRDLPRRRRRGPAGSWCWTGADRFLLTGKEPYPIPIGLSGWIGVGVRLAIPLFLLLCGGRRPKSESPSR